MKQLVRFFECNKRVKISAIFGTKSVKIGTFFVRHKLPQNHFHTVYQEIRNVKKQIDNFWHEKWIYALFFGTKNTFILRFCEAQNNPKTGNLRKIFAKNQLFSIFGVYIENQITN